jgi:hypothetical protein
MTPPHHEIGTGATAELSLRVSVATLVRVLFQNSNNDELMLALERKATLRETEDGRAVKIKSQPFGGAIRILNVDAVRDLLGDFHFGSERSLAEQDFRIFIQPEAWPVLREFCLEHINLDYDLILETSPRRELVEEFAETLSINLKSEQYVYSPATTIVEGEAAATDNVYARGNPTVRIYRIFEARITDSSLAVVMLKGSNSVSNQSLSERALADAENGGKGRANGILTLPWKHLEAIYRAMLPATRNLPIMFGENQLHVTVSAIFDDIAVPRYQRVV